MNYIDKFKEMIALKDEIVFRPINQNQCNIYFANDDLMGIEQEVYYEFDDFGNYFEIYRVARGNKEKTASFKEDKYAYLYMGLQINKDLKSETNPIPEEIEYLNDERESNYEKLKQLISRYIDFSLFSVFELKNDAICLIADGDIIWFIMWTGEVIKI
ncbi:MAG: hypothetical protein VB031_09500 [Eubacteriaceae bacterium]|nr:hypothetical protein [Eubacteriaceae bacterium]